MSDRQKDKENEDQKERKTIFDRLFSKPSKDEAYVSDLKTQWSELETAGRFKFIIGALIGLLLFISALLLAYLALSALIG